MELLKMFELKILGYYLFFLLWYLPSFVWALTTASQPFRFVLQHQFGRTKFSITYNGQGAAFVYQAMQSLLKGFLVHNLHLFIVYFGVEKLEQSVTLSQLIIFYLSTNNARQEERIVKVM